MEYDFSKLTEAQQRVLTFQGWTIDDISNAVPQPHERTVKKLIERGLVIEKEAKWRGMIVKEYEVPVSVHMAWCRYCSEKLDA